jgi:hypothetical protein
MTVTVTTDKIEPCRLVACIHPNRVEIWVNGTEFCLGWYEGEVFHPYPILKPPALADRPEPMKIRVLEDWEFRAMDETVDPRTYTGWFVDVFQLAPPHPEDALRIPRPSNW